MTIYIVFFIIQSSLCFFFFFFFNDTATTEIYTLSLHDALPTCTCSRWCRSTPTRAASWHACRSEEHTSELQSHLNLVCRLLLEKKKKNCNLVLYLKKKKKKKIYIKIENNTH